MIYWIQKTFFHNKFFKLLFEFDIQTFLGYRVRYYLTFTSLLSCYTSFVTQNSEFSNLKLHYGNLKIMLI